MEKGGKCLRRSGGAKRLAIETGGKARVPRRVGDSGYTQGKVSCNIPGYGRTT